MMAFFDSLIQREIEGWDSDPEDSLSSDTDSSFCKEVDCVLLCVSWWVCINCVL